MPETILLAILFAKIKKYDIKPLFKTWVIYPVVIFEIITLIGQGATYFGNYEIVQVLGKASFAYLICYLFLIFKYELYKQALIGSAFILAGGFLNDIAIKANGGFMPVYKSLSNMIGSLKFENYNTFNDIHIIGNVDTKLKLLTDYIDLGYTILSVGDIFIRVFIFIVIYYSIKKCNLQRRKEAGEINNI